MSRVTDEGLAGRIERQAAERFKHAGIDEDIALDLRDCRQENAALKAHVERLREALENCAGELDSTVHCAACGRLLTEEGPHAADCAVIAARITLAATPAQSLAALQGQLNDDRLTMKMALAALELDDHGHGLKKVACQRCEAERQLCRCIQALDGATTAAQALAEAQKERP
jgi:hypothetical protein